MNVPRSSANTAGSISSTTASDVSANFKAREMIQHDAIMIGAMRSHLALASNTALRHAPDALRVLVVSAAPLVRAGLMTMLGAYRDLDLTELGPADVILSDETVADADVPMLILVRDAAAAAAALAGGARGVL